MGSGEFLLGLAGMFLLIALAFPVGYGIVMISLFIVEWCVAYVARKLRIEEYSEKNYVHIIQKMNSPMSSSNSYQSNIKKSP